MTYDIKWNYHYIMLNIILIFQGELLKVAKVIVALIDFAGNSLQTFNETLRQGIDTA